MVDFSLIFLTTDFTDYTENSENSIIFSHGFHGFLSGLEIRDWIFWLFVFLLLFMIWPDIIELAEAEISTIDLQTCIGNNSVSLINKKSAK